MIWKHESRTTGWWGQKSGSVELDIPEDTFQYALPDNTQDD